MNINELTIGQAKEISAMFPVSTCSSSIGEHPYEIGENYFIRTVTYHLTGKLVAVFANELVIESAAWIADSGRFQDALKSCDFSEVEMFPATSPVIVGRGAIVDCCKIATIPTCQK